MEAYTNKRVQINIAINYSVSDHNENSYVMNETKICDNALSISEIQKIVFQNLRFIGGFIMLMVRMRVFKIIIFRLA